MRVIRCVILLLFASEAWPKVDDATGLIEDVGWRMVQAHCSGCHDLNLVTAQRGNREFWEQAIRRMQKTQNLWQLDETTERRILTYLAKNYAPEFTGRRRPLPAALRPN